MDSRDHAVAQKTPMVLGDVMDARSAYFCDLAGKGG